MNKFWKYPTLRGWWGEGVEKQKTLPFIVETIRSRSSPPSTLSAKTMLYLHKKITRSFSFWKIGWEENSWKKETKVKEQSISYEVSPMSTTSAQPVGPSMRYK
jgi:hypothetical protein